VTGGSSIHTRPENGVANLTQSRTVTVSGGGWKDWYRDSHTSWSPAAGSQTSNYTQGRHYRQWKKYTYTHKVGSSTVHTRDVESYESWIPESRSVSVSWSGWTNGTKTCGSWTPSASNYFQGDNVNQTRSCETPQTGKYVHKVGSSTIRTHNVSNTSNTNESRTVQGTKTLYGGVASYCSAWTNNGGIQYGSWSPSASSRGYNTSNYTQSRSRKQPQKQTCYDRRYNYKTKTYEKVGSDTNNYRNSTLSNSSRAITVSATSYANSSGRYGYTGWTRSGAPAGKERRSFKYDQKRTITHKSGSTTLRTATQTRTLTGWETRNLPDCRYSTTGARYFWSENQKISGSGYLPATYTKQWAGSNVSGSSYVRGSLKQTYGGANQGGTGGVTRLYEICKVG